MDIAGVSMALSDISLQSQVSTSVLDKSMEANEAMGQGLVQMIDAAAMERSVYPGVGANMDLKI